MNDNVFPLPYSSGPDPGQSPEDRAREVSSRTSAARNQRHALHHLSEAGRHGLTYRELCGITGWHHGQASGALSVLHKAKVIARLKERRNRCLVYVLPQYVAGRDTEEQSATATTALMNRMAEVLSVAAVKADCGHGPIEQADCWCCQAKAVVRQYALRH